MEFEFLKVCFMGVIEGITEFFPVSSTAHLILFEQVLNVNIDHPETFHIAIQIGAISAATFHFRRSFIPFLNPRYWMQPAAKKMYLATIPVLIVGFIAYDFIKEHLFSLNSVVYALLIGGVIMIFVEKVIKPKITVVHLEHISYKQALIIGICQCASLWPGMSRSASTIVAALVMGCSYTIAAEFSFIIGVPVLASAAAYDLLKMYTILTQSDIINILIGIFVSFLVGYLAILTFISLLKRYKLTPFAIYRIIIGTLLIGVLWL